MRRKAGTLVPLEHAILGAAVDLHNGGAAQFHGYQIGKHLAETSDRRGLTAYGTLYRALGRLEAMGLVQSEWEDPQTAAAEKRPLRRLYALTANGFAIAESERRGAARAAMTAKRTRKGLAPA